MKPRKIESVVDQVAEKSADVVLAEQIQAISRAMQKLISGPLNERALLLILSDASGLGRIQVKRLLVAMADLEKTYLKPAK